MVTNFEHCYLAFWFKIKPKLFLIWNKNSDKIMVINLSKKFKSLHLLIYNIHIRRVFSLKFALETCDVYCSGTHVALGHDLRAHEYILNVYYC